MMSYDLGVRFQRGVGWDRVEAGVGRACDSRWVVRGGTNSRTLTTPSSRSVPTNRQQQPIKKTPYQLPVQSNYTSPQTPSYIINNQPQNPSHNHPDLPLPPPQPHPLPHPIHQDLFQRIQRFLPSRFIRMSGEDQDVGEGESAGCEGGLEREGEEGF